MITIIMSYAQLKRSKSYSFSQEYQFGWINASTYQNVVV